MQNDIEALKARPEGDAWCQPMDCGRHTPRKFIVRFADDDVGDAVFGNEAEARAYWEKANTNWNCYLFGTLPLEPDRLDTFSAHIQELEGALAKLRVAAQNQGVSDANEIASLKDNQMQAQDAIGEGLEILINLADSVTKHGNYSPEATCTFIDQAGQCFRLARATLNGADRK